MIGWEEKGARQMNEIGTNIKTLRREKRMSQEQLAQALHVTRQTVSAWERGVALPGLDTLKEPPMFQVSETHFAKTWLLDPRAPKTEKPEIIQNIHEKLLDAFNI